MCCRTFQLGDRFKSDHIARYCAEERMRNPNCSCSWHICELHSIAHGNR